MIDHSTIINPQHELAEITSGVSAAMKNIFPIKGAKNTIELDNIVFDHDESAIKDLKAQTHARLNGKTYAFPFHADIKITDNATGAVLDKKRMRLGTLPIITPRGSFIVDGNEYYATSLMRKKPGIYTKYAENDKPFVEVNSSKGRNMKLHLDDDGIITLGIAGKNIKMVPLLRALGVQDKKINDAIGKELFDTNMTKAHLTEQEITKAHQAMHFEKKPKNMEEGIEGIKNYLETNTEFRPEVNTITLGKPFTTLTPDAMLAAASKLIKLTRKDIEPDDAEHMAFKTIHSFGDLLKERLEKNYKTIRMKVARNADKGKTAQEVLGAGFLNPHIYSIFNEFPNINVGDVVNPLAMVTGFTRTTVFGPGAINDSHAVTKENQNVSVSQMGFLDVFHTPEKQAGLSNQITLGTFKVGDTLMKTVFDKNAKTHQISPVNLLNKSMVFPDQVAFENGTFKPKDKQVLAIKGGKIQSIPWGDADYVAPAHSYFFDHATNMIPFLNSDHGNRSYMAGKHMEQSIALKHREDPLVKSTIVPDFVPQKYTVERMLGKDFAVLSDSDGIVTEINFPDHFIAVTDKKGTVHKHPIYVDFPLTNGSMITHEALVKVGDSVKEGQTLADSNFTRDGRLALGVNLTTAYMPWEGYNFEDGLVISEDAAKKLTSMHLYEEDMEYSDDDIISKNTFVAHSPSRYKNDQLSNITDDGIIAEGSVVKTGDPLVLMLSKRKMTNEAEMLKRIDKALVQPFVAKPLEWDHIADGVVTKVVKVANTIKIYVKTEEPANIGDKLAGRHGNKGVITKIIPTEQMPRTVGGTAIDIMYSPSAVVGRTNVGQLHEIAASKIAGARGKPYVAPAFGDDNTAKTLVDELRQVGLTDKDNVVDPVTNKVYEAVPVGKQYMLKLEHMAQKKMSARHTDSYDAYEQPIKGGESSGIAIDRLTFNALLAHGARHNLFEMAQYKSQKNDDLWRAFESNKVLPLPKVPFAFQKLVDMLKAMGVNVKKDGQTMQLLPMRQEDVLTMSNGEITNAFDYKGKNREEIEGGIFDKKITGGLTGERWSHIKLTEPLPNPLFADAIKALTKLTDPQFERIVSGETYVAPDGTLNTDGNGKTGGEGIKALLSKINPSKRLNELKAASKDARKDKLNTMNKEMRYLKPLVDNKLRPDDVYMMSNIPVLPPAMRPVYPNATGKMVISPVNYLYKFLLEENNELKNIQHLPDPLKANLRRDMYVNVGALSGVNSPTVRMIGRDYKGILDIIAGKDQPKNGFFQSRLYSKRQDMSARAVIALNNDLHPDQIGVPEDIAWEVFKTHLRKKMSSMGLLHSDIDKRIKARDPLAKKLLTGIMSETPMLLNRAPSLHKYSIMAMMPTFTNHKTLQLNPLVVLGYNADFDGDAMHAFVPVTEKARQEAFNMLPSRHLFNVGKSGQSLLLVPQKEAAGGVWYASIKEDRLNKNFTSEKEVLDAYNKGEIKLSTAVLLNGKETTPGQLQLRNIIPQDVAFGELTAGNQKKMLRDLAGKHPKEYATIVNKLTQFGNKVASEARFGFGVSDLYDESMIKKRDRILDHAKDAIRTKGYDPKTLISVLGAKTRESILGLQDGMSIQHPLRRLAIAGLSKGNNTKGQSMTYLQMIGAPLLVEDIKKRVIPVPITRSYAEGLSLSQYLATSFGSRQGMADKASSTADPGAMQKEIVAASIDQVITKADCGTTRGVTLSLDDQDITDRYLAKSVAGVGNRNDIVTPKMVSDAKKLHMDTLEVRSVMTCEAHPGICQMCMGLDVTGKPYPVGTNIGVVAGQAMGEPVTQMAMRSFHQGGILGSATVANAFPQIKQVLSVPKIYAGATAIAGEDGKIVKIHKNPLGGNDIWINNVKHTVPAGQNLLVKPGQQVTAGQKLGEGLINPRDVLAIRGMDAARQQMVNDLQRIYGAGGEDIRRRMFEVVVKSATNTTRVVDPGDSNFLPGDYAKLDEVTHFNKTDSETIHVMEALDRDLAEDTPIVKKGATLTQPDIDRLLSMGYNEVKVSRKRIRHAPELHSTAMVPVHFEKDWLVRLGTTHLKDAVIEGALTGAKTQLHGYNPVPSWVMGTEFGKSPDKDPAKY